MSLLDFFQSQRWRWQNQPDKQLPDFLVGGLVALDKAEADFKTLPFSNALHDAHHFEQQLNEVSYRLNFQLEQARKQLAAQQQRLEEQSQKLQELRQQVEKRPKWGTKARRALQRMTNLLDHPYEQPELTLRDLASEVRLALWHALEEKAALGDAETPPPPVPLPE